MTAFQIAVASLDYAAVFVFAATGALAAARNRHDIVTFGFFAAITGVGGGTLRDLLIGTPVFWVQRPDYLLVCLAAALAVWVFGPERFRERALIWLDALGLSAYCVVGAAKALSVGVGLLPAIVMGVLTATVGGIIRDIVAQHPSVLLRREIYVTAALTGASVFVVLEWLGVDKLAGGLAGFAAALLLRGCAIVWQLQLPAFRNR
ncbi:MAG TPA: trimeric intracellular cation channel family protein [Caulobacteraceae bacterium]|nr:trimeric intracellular cation channel family protein [Caulobacteraceae bacterium]